ncbi:MAG: FAD/NAD(P)-binding protein [Holosporales bacterium]
MTDKTDSIAIVGGGAAAVTALCEILKKLNDSPSSLERLSIDVFDINQTLGAGFAYDPEQWSPCQLMNHSGWNQQTPRPHELDKPQEWSFNDFLVWLGTENGLQCLEQHPEFYSVLGIEDLNSWKPDPEVFYPRGLFGYYLQNVFAETVDALKKMGIPVTVHSETEVIGYETALAKTSLTYRHDNTVSLSQPFKNIIVLTGHWPCTRSTSDFIIDGTKKATERFLALDNTPKKSNIGFIGMGLTGIDYLIETASYFGNFNRQIDGQFTYTAHPGKKISFQCFSRNGLFSNVRPIGWKNFPKQHWTEQQLKAIYKEGFALKDLITLVTKEARVIDPNLSWRRLVGLDSAGAENYLDKCISDAKNPNSTGAKLFFLLSSMAYGNLPAHTDKGLGLFFNLVGDIYANLNSASQQEFRKSFLSHYIRHFAPTSMVNGEKLKALFNAGVLNTHATHSYADLCPTSNGVDVVYIENGVEKNVNCARVFMAIGQSGKITEHPSTLMQQLLKDFGAPHSSPENDRVTELSVNKNYRLVSGEEYSGTSTNAPSDFFLLGPALAAWGIDRGFLTGYTDALAKVVESIFESEANNSYIQGLNFFEAKREQRY